MAFTPIERAPEPDLADPPSAVPVAAPAPPAEPTQPMLAAAGAVEPDLAPASDVEPDVDPGLETPDAVLAEATPPYIETVPLPETVTDDPALDAEQPDDPPPATTKPESQPAEPEVTMGLEQPAPEQAAEHRE